VIFLLFQKKKSKSRKLLDIIQEKRNFIYKIAKMKNMSNRLTANDFRTQKGGGGR